MGKNRVAMNYVHEETMQNVVKYLRESWHGNASTFGVTDVKNKRPVDCSKLWARIWSIAGTNCVPLCEGISGEIGKLEVYDSFRYESVNLPIDTLVVDLTHVGEEDNEFSQSEVV